MGLLLVLSSAVSACSSDHETPGAVDRSAPSAALDSFQSPAWAMAASYLGPVESATAISLRVHLALPNLTGARALLDQVSDPASPSYHQFLAPEEWATRFAPSETDVALVRTHLEANGLSVAFVPSNRAYLDVRGPASSVESAFGVRLGRYRAEGEERYAPLQAPRLPREVASRVLATTGLSTPTRARPPAHHAMARARADATTAPNCANYYGQYKDTSGSPRFAPGYAKDLPLAPCSAYVPSQMRKAYGFDDTIASGLDGRGQTVAVVGAWTYPTIFTDPQTFASHNDAKYPLESAQFRAVSAPGTPTVEPPDEVDEYLGEFTSDIEAVHAFAPKADIVYVAAQSDSSSDFLAAFNLIVSQNLASLVTLSAAWPESSETAPAPWEVMAIEAGLEGIGIHIASGDLGDNVLLGSPSPSVSFPASLPEITVSGGTSLELDEKDQRVFEVGWANSFSFLIPAQCGGPWDPASGVQYTCPTDDGGAEDAGAGGPLAWWPVAPGGFLEGANGGTSTLFRQPLYQRGIVPPSVAGRASPMRALPDVAMVADFYTPTLQGCTCYGPYIEGAGGGESYSTPAFTAIVALAQQLHGHRYGAINPTLYAVVGPRSGLTDIVPSHEDRAVFIPNGAPAGVLPLDQIVTFEYAGPENSLRAAVGWDDETGLGVPDGARFLATLP